MSRTYPSVATMLTIACCLALVPGPTLADGKVSLYVSRMQPTDVDARRFSRTSWGGGIDAVVPWPAARDMIALTAGLEITSMLSQSTLVYDPILRETLTQSTDQNYGRFFLGGRVGPHGPGLVRPHAGANLALVWYGISTNIELPDPNDPSKPLFSKTLDSRYKAALGYDVNAGTDLNIAGSVPIEIGMRFLKSYNVPQPLGEGAVSVSPSYFQIYFSIGLGFDFIHRVSNPGDESGLSPG